MYGNLFTAITTMYGTSVQVITTMYGTSVHSHHNNVRHICSQPSQQCTVHLFTAIT